MHIGRKIKKFRDENKLSQKEFAEKIGVTQAFLSHLENGRLNVESPSLEKKILIAIGEETESENKVENPMKATTINDNVHSPKHYMIPGCNFESIDIIKVRLGNIGFMFFLEGNVTKYLIRAEKKNGKEDYKKAKKYLSWLIDMKELIPHELFIIDKNEIGERCQSNWLDIISGITQGMNAKKALILNEAFTELYTRNYEKTSVLIDKLLEE